MYIMKEKIIEEQTIKNSRFITCLFPISKKEEVSSILEQMKVEYPKATHYCYAYITHDHKKASDDGEPGGTAGMPILNILEKEEMMNILAVVIRYFGGIKLGTGGLMRAYSSSVRDTLKKVNKILLVKGVRIQIVTSYDKQKDLDYLLRNSKIIKKEFLDQVSYIIDCKKEILETLHAYSPMILKTTYIEETDE